MKKHIDSFKSFILNESKTNLYNILSKNFKKIGISYIETYSDNLNLYMNDEEIGTLRFYLESEWLVIDNIELKSNFIGKGIGFSIYESLYITSKELGMKGFISQLFSEEIGQKRSELATRVLDKLINKYGGVKHDCSQWVEDKYKNSKDVYDYFIDGRGKVEIEIV